MFAKNHANFLSITLGLILLASAGCDQSSIASEAQDDLKLDPRLVGRWRHTDAYVSGNFSAAIDEWLILDADGTYEYFKGGVAAGDCDSSLADDGHGDITTGKWSTESRILFTCPKGAGEWQQAGNYLADDGRFMLNKVVWERQ